MAGELRPSIVNSILKDLKKSKKELCQLAKSLPDEDAYAEPYSMLIDGINNINHLIKNLKSSLKDAKEYRKQNPDQFPNRARKWCTIDFNRFTGFSIEETGRPFQKTP